VSVTSQRLIQARPLRQQPYEHDGADQEAGDGQVRFEFGLSVLVAGLDSLKHWTPDQRDSS
jgi:hypothetical protein